MRREPCGGTIQMATVFLVGAWIAWLPMEPQLRAQARQGRSQAMNIRTVLDDGGRLDWSRSGLIAFDKKGPNGFFEVYLMNADGSSQRCVTCGVSSLPEGHKGNPVIHPSGRYIVFQAQFPTPGRALPGVRKLIDFFANPGAGINNTLYAMDLDSRQAWQLIDVPARIGGVLHPQFSHSGNQLLWAERIASGGGEWGTWTLRLADFLVQGGKPLVQNVRSLQPGRQHRFYESHGFSPDDNQIIFSGNLEPSQKESGSDIYTYNLRTNALRNLTDSPDEWDEHAHFSPDGTRIVWISSKGYPVPRKDYSQLRTEYWIMNSDGSDKRQLTHFNDPNSPEYVSGGAVAGDVSWSPDGRELMAYVVMDPKNVKGRIVRIPVQ